MRRLQLGAIYKHYKRNDTHTGCEYLYRVIGVANHTEDLSKLVVYQALYSTPGYPKYTIWTRPYDMFVGDVTLNGIQIPRFQNICPDEQS
jgi:hypothetical protein